MSELLQSLQASSWSEFLRTSTWAFPTTEVLHLISLGLLFGGAVLWDLRLFGFFDQIERGSFQKATLSVAHAGFLGAVLTGSLLFLAEPIATSANLSFRIKLVLIFLALVNISIFHFSRNKSSTQERIHAGASLTLWTLIIAAGRWIAYV